MKKTSNNLIITKIKSLSKNHKYPFPYNQEMLNILKKENHFEQNYYHIKKDNQSAFIIVYKMKLNIFTYGKLNLSLKTSVIGYPCSLCEEGFISTNQDLVLEFAKTLKGPILILNLKKALPNKDYCLGETLPTCVLKLNYNNIDDYLNKMRSSYRRRINIAINNCQNIKIKIINDNSIDIYDLYLNTYNKSDYKLEKLEKGFFAKVDATKIIYLKDNKPVGFTLLKKNNKKLIFMLCGMDYSIDTTDLYYYMLYNIVKYAIDNNCEIIDFGQTSEETKLKFGATLEKRYFYAHHSNKLINLLVKHGKGLLEYKYSFPMYNVMKEKIK